MPSRNQRKSYQPNSFYHIYNRGVNKAKIFHDDQDYKVFLHYLKIILSPIQDLETEINNTLEDAHLENNRKKKLILRLNRALNHSQQTQLFDHIDLLNYCIMPNHFHLLVFQKQERNIEMLMRRLATGYAGYYNNKYKRVGPLFQGRAHASHLYFEPKLQTLVAAQYIERNPLKSTLHGNRSRTGYSRTGYKYSSLQYYLPEQKDAVPLWLKIDHLQNLFAEIKARPNGFFEKQIANHQTLVEFIKSPDEISLEDVRLEHLQRI